MITRRSFLRSALCGVVTAPLVAKSLFSSKPPIDDMWGKPRPFGGFFTIHPNGDVECHQGVYPSGSNEWKTVKVWSRDWDGNRSDVNMDKNGNRVT